MQLFSNQFFAMRWVASAVVLAGGWSLPHFGAHGLKQVSAASLPQAPANGASAPAPYTPAYSSEGDMTRRCNIASGSISPAAST